MQDDSLLYPISAFAALCGISRQTLLFYHQKKLIQPIYVAQNGYRYYSYQQYDTVQAIRTLKDLGTPLSQIAAYLKTGAPTLMELLAQKQGELSQEINRLCRMQNEIAQKRTLAQLAHQKPLDTPWVEGVKKQYFITQPFPQNPRQSDYIRLLSSLTLYCRRAGYQIVATPSGGVSREDMLAGILHKASYFSAQVEQSTGDALEEACPAGECVVLHHQGTYDSCVLGYQKLMDFIKTQGLRIRGGSRETALFNSLATADPSAYITRIQIPVERGNRP